jgi:hypothetical protein
MKFPSFVVNWNRGLILAVFETPGLNFVITRGPSPKVRHSISEIRNRISDRDRGGGTVSFCRPFDPPL